VRKDGGAYVLVAGARRIAACRELGWTETKVTLCEGLGDELAAMRAEVDENTARVPLNPAEIHVASTKLVDRAMEAAKERKRDGNLRGGSHGSHGSRGSASRDLPLNGTSGKDNAAVPDSPAAAIPDAREERHRAYDDVAAALGTSRGTMQRIEAVYNAQHDPDPVVAEVAKGHVADWEAGAGAKANTAANEVAATRHRPRPVEGANEVDVTERFSASSRERNSKKTHRETYSLTLMTLQATVEHLAETFPGRAVARLAQDEAEEADWMATLKKTRQLLAHYIHELEGVHDRVHDHSRD
jgi:hypothetical protein